MKKEDEELAVKMENLQFLTMENLDVAQVCKENQDVMEQVMKQLQQIEKVVSPAEKVGMWREIKGSWSVSSSRAEHWVLCCRLERREKMRALMTSCLHSFILY